MVGFCPFSVWRGGLIRCRTETAEGTEGEEEEGETGKDRETEG